MRKIKGLVVKKGWAKRARLGQFNLQVPGPFQFDRNGKRIHGLHWGCCTSFGYMCGVESKISIAFKKFVEPGEQPMFGFWWLEPRSFSPTAKERQAYTARIIALESFALYCEEHGV